MERRQLEYVVAIADEGSFTAAARRLFVAQPAISAQMKAVERELGVRLFERAASGVTLTAAGVEVVQRARSVLTGFAEIRSAVDEFAGIVRGRVTVGAVRGAPLGTMATRISGFRAAYPAVEVSFVEDESSGLLAGVAGGKIDVALVGFDAPPAPPVRIRTLLDERVRIVVPAEHPWARRSRLRVAELADHALVTLPRGTGVRDALTRAAAGRDVALPVVAEAGSITTVMELVRAGFGAAAVPAAVTATALSAGLIGIDLVAPTVRSRLALAWRENRRRPSAAAGRALLVAMGV